MSSSRRTRFVWLFLLVFIFLPYLYLLKGQNKKTEGEDLYQKGIKSFQEKTFSEALRSFQEYLKQYPKGKYVKELKVKSTIAYFHLRKYSEAEEYGLKVLPSLKGTIWQARLYRILGQHRFAKPHWGYKKRGKITWGRYVQGGRYIWTQREDYQKAVEYLEKAQNHYMALSEKKLPTKKLKTVRHEWIGTDEELIRIIDSISGRWSYYYRPLPSKAFLAKKPKEYNPKFNSSEKILFLYDEAMELAKAGKLDKTTGNLLYSKGMFLVRLGGWNQGSPRKIPPSLHPFRILKRVLKEYPKSKHAPAVLLVMGRILENQSKFLEAKAYYQRLVKEYPKSKWASDAQFYTKEMEKERLSISAKGTFRPGEEPILNLKLRNIMDLHIQVYDFDLAGFLNSNSNKEKAYIRKEIHNYNLKTKDKGDHKYFSMKIKIPVKSVGPYWVKISSNFIEANRLLLISDIAFVQRLDRNKVFLFAADANSGKPITNGKVLIIERYLTPRHTYRVDYYRGRTNQDGIATKFLALPPSSSIKAVVWQGNRFAISNRGYTPYSSSYYTRLNYRFYSITDRPVYRPSHKVHFKAYLRLYKNGIYNNMPNEIVRVRIISPRGKEVYKARHITDENGAIHGSFQLAKKADLGMYRIYYRLQNSRYGYHYSQGNRFRVEEYKKPEFEVLVDTPKKQVKLGQKVKIKIKGRYYFGAPVVGAKVKYQIFRKNFFHSYYPPGPWDWLYGYGYGIRYLDAYYNIGWHNWYFYHSHQYRAPSGELVLQGTGRTNEQGVLEVLLDTSKYLNHPVLKKVDHLFTVKAEMTDQSRRMIRGGGSMKVTRKAFYSYIFSQRGFYTAGDKGKFEVTALKASNEPVQTKGILKIFKVKKVEVSINKDKKISDKIKKLLGTGKLKKQFTEKLTLVHSRPLSTNAEGKAVFEFKTDEPGRYRLIFESKDSWGQTVQGIRDIWFTSKDFTGNQFNFGNLEILMDKRHYEEGETAQVMVNIQQKGATVLLTEEVGSEILATHVLHPKGKSALLEIPISKKHIPNFFLQAVSIYQGKIHLQRVQVFVPPVKKILKLALKPSKPFYRPGEKAKIDVLVTDGHQKPVSVPVCLGVVDQSVYYIQGNLTPDVRKFFYGTLRGWSLQYLSSYSFISYAIIKDNSPYYYSLYPCHGMPPGWWYTGPVAEEESEKEIRDGYSLRKLAGQSQGAPEAQKKSKKGFSGKAGRFGAAKKARAPMAPPGDRKMAKDALAKSPSASNKQQA
ncbi:MAG: outer membrane protein assembly factor BamD [Planctomycetota bacterium]|nr:MAG: outer membrane protein assembly factor BamD [Planctomycetota bacterium]